MLGKEIVRKIEDFVSVKPRSVQEVAKHIGKNWRTASKYLDEIEEEYGTISTRVFREGTRGALKIAYWTSFEKASGSAFQERIQEAIIKGRKKEDFSPFEIYQHIDDNKKKVRARAAESEESIGIEDIRRIFDDAKEQLLIFSGNLSFINFMDKKGDVMKQIDAAAGRGVKIKVLCRVDMIGRSNIEKLLSLNFKNGKENIEIRHCEQPLRAIIIDNKVASIKEVNIPTGRRNEGNNKIFLFYTIKDKDWIEWMSKIFWKMFSCSIDANKRLEEMNKIRLDLR